MAMSMSAQELQMNTDRTDQQGEAFIVFEDSDGRRKAGARDYSDEMLPEGEQISDAERAAIRARKPMIRWSKADPADRRFRPRG